MGEDFVDKYTKGREPIGRMQAYLKPESSCQMITAEGVPKETAENSYESSGGHAKNKPIGLSYVTAKPSNNRRRKRKGCKGQYACQHDNTSLSNYSAQESVTVTNFVFTVVDHHPSKANIPFDNDTGKLIVQQGRVSLDDTIKNRMTEEQIQLVHTIVTEKVAELVATFEVQAYIDKVTNAKIEDIKARNDGITKKNANIAQAHIDKKAYEKLARLEKELAGQKNLIMGLEAELNRVRSRHIELHPTTPLRMASNKPYNSGVNQYFGLDRGAADFTSQDACFTGPEMDGFLDYTRSPFQGGPALGSNATRGDLAPERSSGIGLDTVTGSQIDATCTDYVRICPSFMGPSLHPDPVRQCSISSDSILRETIPLRPCEGRDLGGNCHLKPMRSGRYYGLPDNPPSSGRLVGGFGRDHVLAKNPPTHSFPNRHLESSTPSPCSSGSGESGLRHTQTEQVDIRGRCSLTGSHGGYIPTPTQETRDNRNMNHSYRDFGPVGSGRPFRTVESTTHPQTGNYSSPCTGSAFAGLPVKEGLAVDG